MRSLVAKSAKPSDSNEISNIHAFCWRETYDFMPQEVLNNRSQNYRKNQWDSWFGNKKPTEELFKLLSDDKIVGFCFCKESLDKDLPNARGELHALYILPEYRGGISGPLAFLSMSKFLRENDRCPLSLWAFKENRARLWYSQLGFKRVISRDRVIQGHAIPECGYIHTDVDKLIDRLENIVSRG